MSSVLGVSRHTKNHRVVFACFPLKFYRLLTTLAVSVNGKTSKKSVQKYAAVFGVCLGL